MLKHFGPFIIIDSKEYLHQGKIEINKVDNGGSDGTWG